MDGRRGVGIRVRGEAALDAERVEGAGPAPECARTGRRRTEMRVANVARCVAEW